MTTLECSDRLDLIDLYAVYTHAFDSGDAQTLAALFTEDGQFVRDGGEPVRGRAALTALVEAAGASGARRHLVSAIRVTPGRADEAFGKAYVSVVGLNEKSLLLVAVGTYHDEFVRDEGTWLIRRREFVSATSPALAGAPLAIPARPAVPLASSVAPWGSTS